ncbi:hypothetical protein EV122DRAFT_177347, partial [Schizophyllum commune]
STLDLIFASHALADLVVKCTAEDHGHGSDHMVVQARLDLSVPQSEPRPRLRWREADWDQYSDELSKKLDERCVHSQLPNLHTTEAVDTVVRDVSDSLVEAASRAVPRARPSPHSKRWWTSEPTKQLRRLKTAQN